MKAMLVTTFSMLIALPAFAANHTVTMKSISFDPKRIEIKSGDSIEWQNRSLTEHSATSDRVPTGAKAFDTGMIKPEKNSAKITFDHAGVYEYHCTLHGKTMSGIITVN